MSQCVGEWHINLWRMLTHDRARSLHMEIQITSPSTKIVHHEELQTSRTLPVFHGTDRVGGQVILDPTCYQSGRLTMSVSLLISFLHPITFDRNVFRLKVHFNTLLHKRRWLTVHATKTLAKADTSSFLRATSSESAHPRTL